MKFVDLETRNLRGIQDPLKVWQGIIVDGHNRYEIAQRHGLSFATTEMQFATRDDAIIWIIKNQFGRRNLSAYDRSILALKLKPVIAAKAKEKQGERTDLNIVKKSCQCSNEPQQPKTVREQKTDFQVAKTAGVSEDTIRKVEKIEQQATPEIKAAVKSGDMSISAAYVFFNSGNNEWYTPAEIIESARNVLGFVIARRGHKFSQKAVLSTLITS